jgi:hypothetical protein
VTVVPDQTEGESMGDRRLGERLAPWIEAAIDASGEDMTWEAAVTPGPQVPGLAVMLWAPGALLGTVVSVQLFLEKPSLVTEDDIAGVVRDAAEHVRQSRTQQLKVQSVSNGHGPDAEQAVRRIIQP